VAAVSAPQLLQKALLSFD